MLSVEPAKSDVIVALRASRQSDLGLMDTLKMAIARKKAHAWKQAGVGWYYARYCHFTKHLTMRRIGVNELLGVETMWYRLLIDLLVEIKRVIRRQTFYSKSAVQYYALLRLLPSGRKAHQC